MANLTWTNHAKDRLKERQFSQVQASQAFSNPDNIIPGKQGNTQQYLKHFGEKTITLIVSTNERGEKVVVSCWIDPPNYGTRDYYQNQRYHEYQKASPFRKIWLIIKEQLGF